MGADSTAAAYLMDRQKAFDPMGAFAAGVQLQTNLQKLTLAGQASQIDTILNVVKLQNEQADNRMKNALAEKQLAIASFNAETNRINANRPRTTKGSSSGFMGAMPTAIDNGDGSWSVQVGDPSQQPTMGEGDGVEPDTQSGDVTVQPLQPGSSEPSLFPGGGSMQATTSQPLPGMGQRGTAPQAAPQGGSHVPGMPDPFNPPVAQQATVAGPNGAAQASAVAPKKGLYGPPTISWNEKTGSRTITMKPLDKEDAPVQPADTGVLQKWNAIYDGFGKVAVPTNDKAYPQGFKFEDKPTLHGKGITDLSADEQKRFGDLSRDLMDLTLNNKLASPEAKMAAVGITNPKDMTEDLWTEGWKRVQGNPNAPIDPQASANIIRKATELAGFKNLMFGTDTNTPEVILSQMGIDTKGMFPKQQGAQPGGRTVSVAASGQDQMGGAPQTGVASVGGMRAAAQPAPTAGFDTKLTPEQEIQFQQWKKENAPNDSGTDYDLRGAFLQNASGKNDPRGHGPDTFKKPNHPTFSDESQYSTPERPGGHWGTDAKGKTTFEPSQWMASDPKRMAELRDYMKRAEPDTQLIIPAVKPGRFMTPEAAPEPKRDAAGHIVRPEKPTSPFEIKRQAANVQWETEKKKVHDLMLDTTSTSEFVQMREGKPDSYDPESSTHTYGRNAGDLRTEWIKDNAGKLGIKGKDGKPPTEKTVVFVDHTGRDVTLGEIVDQIFKDKRYNSPETATEAQSAAATAKQELSPAAKSAYEKALGTKSP